MLKGQALNLTSFKTPLWLGITVLILFFMAACAPEINPQSTPTNTSPANTASFTSTKIIPTNTLLPSMTPAAKTATSTPPPPTATPTPDCLQSGGELQTVSFYSEVLKADFNVRVYLPPCYTSKQYAPYPVIYLLHGLSYDNDQWLRIGLVKHMDQLIADGSMLPTMVVLPQEAVMAAPQISDFDLAITGELIPFIDQHYSTNPTKAYRAIGGVSRGAGWSVRIGFENPALFTKVGAHSLALFEADGGKLIGWMIQTPKEDLPEVFIDIGREDKEWQTARDFANLLDAHNIPHEWYLFTGDHNEAYWSDHLNLYLRWYTRDW